MREILRKEKVFPPLFLLAILSFCLFFFLPFDAKAASTIHITQTTGQYVLNQKNTTYILDNNLTATGTAFVVAADTVTLDLNGHTVTFGTGGGDNRYGVAFAGYAMGSFPDVSNYNFTDSCVIKNGRIVHGVSGKPYGCAAIYSPDGSARNVAVKNVYAYAKGINTNGIYFERGGNFDIEDDSVQMAMDSTTNRMATKSAISLTAWSGYGFVKNCVLYGYGQVGINFTSSKANAVTAAEISGNELHIDGITTNPYSMIIAGFSYEQQGVRLLVHHNRITAPDSVSNRGIIFEGIYGGANTGVDGARVYSNYIETKAHGNAAWEEGIDGFTHSLRMREEDGSSAEKFWDNEFYNDTIIANGYWVDENIHGNGFAVRITLTSASTHSAGNIFHNNVIIANSQDTHLQCRTYAIAIDGHKGTRNTQFYDNVITSNAKIFRFAAAGGDSVMFRSNTVNKGANPCHFSTFLYDTWTNNSVGNKFLDNTLGSGVSYTDIEKSAGAGESRNFLVKWDLDVTVKDSLNNVVSGAQIVIKDKNNAQVFSGTTDAQGKVYTALTEYSYNVNNSNKVEYNPYTVIASKGGQSAQTQVNMNSSKQITIQNDPGQNNCPSVPVLSLPVDRDTVLGLRPNLVLNNSTDADSDSLTYDFQIYFDSQMTDLAASETNITQGTNITYWQVGADLPDESWYWWKARSYDGTCYSDWSGASSFYVKKWVSGVDDSQPDLKDPTDGTTLTNARPVLETYNINGFDSLVYYFQLSSDSQFTGSIQSGPVSQGDIITRWRVSRELSAGNYCWRTRAFDGSEFSLWSEVGKFAVSPEIHVYPNPFKPSTGDQTIIFGSIPIGSNIKVTTLSGELIKSFVNTEEDRIVWNAKNEAGKDVASGVYLYFVDFSGGSASGKIVIIR